MVKHAQAIKHVINLMLRVRRAARWQDSLSPRFFVEQNMRPHAAQDADDNGEKKAPYRRVFSQTSNSETLYGNLQNYFARKKAPYRTKSFRKWAL